MKKINSKNNLALRLLPLTLTVLVTALILEQAQIARMGNAPEDSLPLPVTDYLYPAAVLFLLAGYGLSAVALLWGWRQKKSGE